MWWKSKVLVVVVLVCIGFFVFPSKLQAQTCSGSGSSTYTNYQCAFDPIGGYYCQTNGTVTNSGACGWNNGQCVFRETDEPRCSVNSTNTGCILSNQCFRGDCYNPSGCNVSAGPTSTPPLPSNTPRPGTTSTPVPPPTAPPPPPTRGPDVPWCCGGNCPGNNSNCCGHPAWNNGRACTTDPEWVAGFNACTSGTSGATDPLWCPVVQNNNPKGIHDSTSCQYAAEGWACDQDFNGAMRIRVFVNDQGTTRMIYDGPTTNNRPDVRAAGECLNLDTGFAVPMPVQYMDGISRTFWVDFPTNYASNGSSWNMNPPTGAFNTNRTVSCPVPSPTPIGLPTYCQINDAVVGGVTYTGPFTMNVGETARFTYFGGGPGVARSALYSSPVSAPNTWTTLGSGSSINNANFSCTTPGQYQVVCNALRSDNSIACTGNPWSVAYPSCGNSDSLAVTCRAGSCSPTLSVSPPLLGVEVGGASGNFSINVGQTTGCTGLAVNAQIINPAIASSTGIVSTGTNSYSYPVTGLSSGNTQVRVDLTNNGQLVTSTSNNISVACTPPTAPASISATDNIFRIRVSWTSTDPNVTGFELSRDGAVIATLSRTVANPPNYTISGSSFTYVDGPTPGLCGTPHTYTVTSLNANRPSCGRSTSVASAIGRCDNYEAWWGVNGGSVAAGGRGTGSNAGPVNSDLPSWAPTASAPLPAFPPTYVSNNAPGSNRPGYIMGSNLTGFTTVQANQTSFVASGLPSWNTAISRNENSYISLLDRATTTADAFTINTTLIANQGNWASTIAGANASNNVTTVSGGPVSLVRNTIGTGQTMTFDGSINVGGRVLLFVDGNVQINAPIRVPGGGFFGIIAAGNITLGPQLGDGANTFVERDPNTGQQITLNYNAATGVGADIRASGYQPHLEGVYFAQGTFDTGAVDVSLTNPASFSPGRFRLLRIDGSVIGMNGITLARDVRGPYPAEYISFRPDFVYILHQIGLRRKVYQELLAP